MKRRRCACAVWCAFLLVSACSGCVDAAAEGLAGGVRIAIMDVVRGLLTAPFDFE